MIQLPVVLLNTHDDTSPTSVLDVLAMTFWALGFLIEAYQRPTCRMGYHRRFRTECIRGKRWRDVAGRC